MKAHMTLTLEGLAGAGVKTRERRAEKADGKLENWFARFDNFMRKFVAYHQHESLRQEAASPFIWTE